MTTTDRDKLPQYNGRPVPWVTRWTNEVSNERYNLAMRRDMSITYADDQNNIDSRGVLWQREGISRGGKPDWASVSTYRQRRSMNHRACQVCGEKIPPGRIRWLMPLNEGYELHELPDGSETMITWNPPTCDGCVDLSLELCPHLKLNGYQILKVTDYSVWGVSGLLLIENGGKAYPVNGLVAYESDDLSQIPQEECDKLLKRVMAQQTVVRFDKYVIEEVVQGTRPAPTPSDIEQSARNFLRNLEDEIHADG